MRRSCLIFMLVCCVAAANAQPKETMRDTTALIPIEVPARFPGGMDKFYEYLRKNFRYPQVAVDNHIEGRVILQFTVNTNGAIDNIKILKGLSPETNAEAARLVVGSANWLPASQNGKFVRSTLTIPITFNLMQKKEKP